MWSEQDFHQLRGSGLFDADWYHSAYRDVAYSGLSAWEHFKRYGWFLERRPGPEFDPEAYRQRYADIAANGLDPLLHYLRHGMAEGRNATTAAPQQLVVEPAVRLAVVLHAYHLELVPELVERLSVIARPFDLFITTPHAPEAPALQQILQHYPQARVRKMDNGGRDIRPFLQLLPELQGYELCLKLHTKKGVTPVARAWRDALVQSVLPGRQGTGKLLAALYDNPDVQLAGPQALFLSAHAMMFGNRSWLERLTAELGMSLERDWGFFAGSMFWCRPQALAGLAATVAGHAFEQESGQQDGELAHAVERLVAGVIGPQEQRVLLLSAQANSDDVALSFYADAHSLGRTMPSQLLKPAPPSVRLAGDLNTGEQAVIKGWLVDHHDDAPRTAVVTIDGNVELEVAACDYRRDLDDNGIHQGKHSFTLYPPLRLVDGRTHQLTLKDKASGQEVAKGEARWSMTRRFTDFDGYLAHSLVDPFLPRPFREEDKRCFATMENIADALVRDAQALEAMPLVSIVMPCYNRMQTVPAAVQSVIDQDYAHWELLLIDDGSSDGTREWCEQQAQQEPRITLIALPENAGVSHARNCGLAQAKGQYITYLDSDNQWDPRYISAMVGAYARLPEAQALYSGLYHYYGESDEPAGVLFGSFNRSLLFNKNYIDLNAFTHTREVYAQLGGFDEELPRFVDWDLIRRYSQHVAMMSVPVILTHYYIERASNTITANAELFGFLDQVRNNTGSTWSGKAQSGKARQPDTSTPPSGLHRGITVVIPSFESADDMADCLESLMRLELGELLEVVVVDNASSSAEVIALLKKEDEQGRIKALFNDRNYGFTYAVNRGMAHANPEHDLVLLNNDALMEPGALEALQDAAYTLPGCGIVVPQQVLPGGTPTLNTHVPYADAKQPCDVNISHHHANVVSPPVFHDGSVLELSFAPFFCVYIPRDVYRRAGPLDEQFGRHYRSDRIYCDVIRHVLGLKIYHVSDALVFHKLQKSTQALSTSSDADFDLMFKKNQWDEPTRCRLGYRVAPWDL